MFVKEGVTFSSGASRSHAHLLEELELETTRWAPPDLYIEENLTADPYGRQKIKLSPSPPLLGGYSPCPELKSSLRNSWGRIFHTT